jgi:hypothetical protein
MHSSCCNCSTTTASTAAALVCSSTLLLQWATTSYLHNAVSWLEGRLLLCMLIHCCCCRRATLLLLLPALLVLILRDARRVYIRLQKGLINIAAASNAWRLASCCSICLISSSSSSSSVAAAWESRVGQVAAAWLPCTLAPVSGTCSSSSSSGSSQEQTQQCRKRLRCFCQKAGKRECASADESNIAVEQSSSDARN